jgi:hypothetical protein
VSSGFYPRYLIYFVNQAGKSITIVNGVNLDLARVMAREQAKARGNAMYILNLVTGSIETVEPKQKAS